MSKPENYDSEIIDSRKSNDCDDCSIRALCIEAQIKRPRVLALLIDVDERYVEGHMRSECRCVVAPDTCFEQNRLAVMGHKLAALLIKTQEEAQRIMDEFDGDSFNCHKVGDE